MYIFKLRTAFIVLMSALIITIGTFVFIKTHSSVFVAADSKNVASSDENRQNDEKNVPIIMYHSILKDTKRLGKYVIAPSQFEEDLKFIKDNGYTTIVMQDLIDYVYSGKELPEKPIILTFDDGYYNNYLYAYPLLKAYNQKAVISIIGKYTDLYTDNPDENANYSHITWDNAKEMNNSGLVEIQNHSYDLHTTGKKRNGSKRNKGESLEQYENMLRLDIGKLQQEFSDRLGSAPTTYTYPFGSISLDSVEILKNMGFKATLSCESGMNKIKRSPDDLYRLKRYIRTSKISVKDILGRS